RSPEAVSRGQPVLSLLKRYGCVNEDRYLAYVFADTGGGSVRARFFFPKGTAIAEDPATGSACANLGGWFLAQGAALPLSRVIRQGDEVGRPVTADVPQHRGPSARAPRASHHGQQEQPAFVDEDEPRSQAVGFFLMRGQSCLIQRRIPSSSRSQARRMGRCGVQPRERSNRPM